MTSLTFSTLCSGPFIHFHNNNSNGDESSPLQWPPPSIHSFTACQRALIHLSLDHSLAPIRSLPFPSRPHNLSRRYRPRRRPGRRKWIFHSPATILYQIGQTGGVDQRNKWAAELVEPQPRRGYLSQSVSQSHSWDYTARTATTITTTTWHNAQRQSRRTQRTMLDNCCQLTSTSRIIMA